MPSLVFQLCQKGPPDDKPEKRKDFLQVPRQDSGPSKCDNGMEGKIQDELLAAAIENRIEVQSHGEMSSPQQNEGQCIRNVVRLFDIAEYFFFVACQVPKVERKGLILVWNM
jgi:hypothetical protein